MPAQMLHLCVAKNILDKIECANHGLFYLGAISPDAIHSRPGTGRTDKSKTHLHQDNRADWAYAVSRFAAAHSKSESRDFYMGYAVHILTDICWVNEIFYEVIGRHTADPSPLLEERRAYYNDLVLVDYEMFIKSAWIGDVMTLMKTVYPPVDFSLLTAGELDLWRTTTIEWFDTDQRLGKEPLRYMKHEEIDKFAITAAEFAAKNLRKSLIITP